MLRNLKILRIFPQTARTRRWGPSGFLRIVIPQTARTRRWGPSGFLRTVISEAADALYGVSSFVPQFRPPLNLRTNHLGTSPKAHFRQYAFFSPKPILGSMSFFLPEAHFRQYAFFRPQSPLQAVCVFPPKTHFRQYAFLYLNLTSTEN